MPVVVVTRPFIGDEDESFSAEVEFRENEFEKKSEAAVIFFVNCLTNAAFAKNFEIGKNH